MSTQHPQAGYSIYSTPFSRCDASSRFMGWVSAFPQPTPGNQLAGGEGQTIPHDFHNHFTTPTGPGSTQDAQNDAVATTNGSPCTDPKAPSTPQTLPRPTGTELNQGQSSTPASIGTTGVPSSAQECSSPTDSGFSNSTTEVPMVTASCPVMAPTDSSHPQRDTPRSVTCPPTDAQQPLQPRNPTLISYNYDPLQQLTSWGQGNPFAFYNLENLMTLQRKNGDLGLGDRGSTEIRKSFPLSPLDSTHPPVAPYLTQYSCPLDYSLRGNFTARYHVLRACNQITPIPIDIVFNSLRDIYKVNEGVFGEVYSGRFYDTQTRSVYKLVPIEGTLKVNGEIQKRFEQIETEIRVSQRLNTLSFHNGRNQCPGFCQLHCARVLCGTYPRALVRAWDKWHAENQSDNDKPNFSERQLYIIFEYEHCGCDIETFKFQNSEQSFMVLQQVAFTLAVAELELDFEHRDLHWGNILVRKTDAKTIDYRIDGILYQVPSAGLKTSIIDFTMARCNDENGNSIFDDLKDDEAQFEGTTDYQFEIYRKMRQINNNNWSEFHPRTNTFWLHYLADKFLKNATYNEPNSTRHKSCRLFLKAFMSRILTFSSCADYVQTLKHYVAKTGQSSSSPSQPGAAPRS